MNNLSEGQKKAMRAAIGSGEQKTDTQPGRGGPLAKRAKAVAKIHLNKPRKGGGGVPAEDHPTFMKHKLDSPGERTASEKNVGTRAARRAVARTAGQPEAARREAGHAALDAETRRKRANESTVNNFEKFLACKLLETRSAESRAKTKGRRMFGTPGRKGRLTDKTEGESTAHGQGQQAGKLIARANVRRKSASDIARGPTMPSVPVTVHALKSSADRQERSAVEKIYQGRKAVKFERGQRIFKKQDAKAEADANNAELRSNPAQTIKRRKP